jgi:hypothetical protein
MRRNTVIALAILLLAILVSGALQIFFLVR